MTNILLAILSGTLLSLSWPTNGFFPLIFIAFIPLLIVQNKLIKQKKSNVKVFALSYLCFFIWNASTTWWIWYASDFGASFAIVVNSFLMSCVFLIFHLIRKINSQKIALLFLVSFWLTFEKIHLQWDFSWPWLNLGNVFSEDILWIQWYQYTGSFGGSLWVWIINIILFLGYDNFQKTKSVNQILKTNFIALIFLSIPMLISLLMFKNYTPKGIPTEVIVTQPNIDPYTEKYNFPNLKISHLLVDLIQKEMTQNVRFILAPETVFADNVNINSVDTLAEIEYIKSYLNSYPKASVLSGISMYKIINNEKEITPESNYLEQKKLWFNDYNSAFFYEKNTPISFYHKTKLVIGVENLPYQNSLKHLLGNLMIDLGGTVALKTTQNQRSVFKNSDNQKIAPVICYESIYGEFLGQYSKNKAQFFGIITNDAWWNDTQGHKQLLSYSRLRAIENRKDIARSSNSGISAFINQKGEIKKSLPYQVRGILKSEILLNNTVTFYAHHGDYIARLAIFITIGIFLLSISLFLRKKKCYKSLSKSL